MAVVQLLSTKILEEIAQYLGIELPEYEVITTNDGWFLAYIDIPIPHDGAVIDVPRCWSVACLQLEAAKEDAARAAILKLKSEFGLLVKDTNYDDLLLYKNLYEHLSIQNNDLLVRLNDLQREHNLLKDLYRAGIAEKTGLIAEQVSMRRTIDEYRSIIDQLHANHAPAAHQPVESDSSC